MFSILINSATKVSIFSYFYSKTLINYILPPLLFYPLDLQLFEDWILEL